MLNPNDDRLYYGNILTPPSEYQLDFAIATTYSLDLDALVGASISLGLSDDFDSNFSENPIYLLEALRKTSDDVALFCENGQIKLPTRVTPLYILLENMIFQVKTSIKFKENRYASFHPKFWLLKYAKNEKDVKYRLIVLSRNLTFDRSWDMSFVMEGQKSDDITDKNYPIIGFLNYLMQFCSDADKKHRIQEISRELEHVNFNLHSNTFTNFKFFVNGINPKFNIKNDPLFSNDSLNELMVMSPFLSKDVIVDFNTRKLNYSKALLFTRLNSLAPLNSSDCSNFEIYTLKDEIIDGESIVSEEAYELSKQDIHAKLYVVENEKFTDLYLGSLNASHNALEGNIEFMIKLQADKNKLNIKTLADDLFNGEKGGSKDPFKLITLDDFIIEDDTDGNDLDLKLKYISRLNSKANIVSENDFYNLEVTFEGLDECYLTDVNVTVKPLLSKKTQDLSGFVVFDKLNKLDLSEFFVINVMDDSDNQISKVIKISTSGMPEDRQNEVISSIITNETAFIKYVAFLLGDDYILNIFESNNFTKVNKGINIQLPELYEKMLRATVYSPEKFKELEFLIQALSDDDVIPDGFMELYNTFVEVLENDG